MPKEKKVRRDLQDTLRLSRRLSRIEERGREMAIELGKATDVNAIRLIKAERDRLMVEYRESEAKLKALLGTQTYWGIVNRVAEMAGIQ